jgi:hypothetical protein
MLGQFDQEIRERVEAALRKDDIERENFAKLVAKQRNFEAQQQRLERKKNFDVICKTRQNALVEPQQTNYDEVWNVWCDRKIADALSDFASIMGEEIAETESKLYAKLRKQISTLRAEVKILRSKIEDRK